MSTWLRSSWLRITSTSRPTTCCAPGQQVGDRDLGLDPVAGAVHVALGEAGQVEHRLAQRLRRDRAGVDADPAHHGVPLGHGDPLAQLRRRDRGLLPARSRADHQQVVVVPMQVPTVGSTGTRSFRPGPASRSAPPGGKRGSVAVDTDISPPPRRPVTRSIPSRPATWPFCTVVHSPYPSSAARRPETVTLAHDPFPTSGPVRPRRPPRLPALAAASPDRPTRPRPRRVRGRTAWHPRIPSEMSLVLAGSGPSRQIDLVVRSDLPDPVRTTAELRTSSRTWCAPCSAADPTPRSSQ